ncbi:MAG: YihY/virulence factor BrkB family protein [Gammaproteobacteria bacterium]
MGIVSGQRSAGLVKRARAFGRLLIAAVRRYLAEDCLLFGAALAYYAIFSLAPVLVVVIAVAGFVFGTDAAQGYVFRELAGLVGADSAALIERAVLAARVEPGGGLASLIALGALIVGASGALTTLSTALNHVFRPAQATGGLVAALRKRLLAVALLLTLGFLLLVSLVLSALLQALAATLESALGEIALLADLANLLVGLLGVWTVTAAILKWLPDRPVSWRAALSGGFIAAVLFTGGKQLVGLYIGRASVVSIYGAAGSLAVLALWMYYVAQAFLFGAAVAASADEAARRP